MEDQVRLFLNTGTRFQDVTSKAGLKGIVSGLNCVHADYNNDGFRDVFILRGGWLGDGGKYSNSLLKNLRNGRFTDVTQSAGLLSFHPTQTAAWADVNKDGYLDLFIGNESRPGDDHPCELFINNGDGTFSEQAGKYGLSQIKSFVKGASFGDIDNDGWVDLYISILGEKNILLRNEEGTFRDISASSGTQLPIMSFPTWFLDVNNDGWDDIFVLSYDTRLVREAGGVYARELLNKKRRGSESKLFINNRNGTFKDKNTKYKIDKCFFAMGCNFGDLDNDGWVDFYVGTGAPHLSALLPNRMFKNVRGQQFEEVRFEGRFGHIQKGHGIGFADFDRDGDQDVYIVLGGAFEGDTYPNVLFDNPIGENNFIVFDLKGVKSNRDAIGAKLHLTFQDGRQIFHTVGHRCEFWIEQYSSGIGCREAKFNCQTRCYLARWIDSRI